MNALLFPTDHALVAHLLAREPGAGFDELVEGSGLPPARVAEVVLDLRRLGGSPTEVLRERVLLGPDR